MDKITAKKIFTFFIIIIMIFSFASCTTETPQDVITEYFQALNRLDFETAGKLLGDEKYYSDIILAIEKENKEAGYDTMQSLYFIDFMYGNVSCEIKNYAHNQGCSVYNCVISSYNAQQVLDKVHNDATKLMNTSKYLNATDKEKYTMLCDELANSYANMSSELLKISTETEIKVMTNSKNYYIEASEEMLKAIGGNNN